MKIILSRKGFDSGYGGYPSPILPDGSLLSLPIPDIDSQIKYNELFVDHTMDYSKLIKDLIGKKLKLEGHGTYEVDELGCHLDPDIRELSYHRGKNWRGIFGQAGSAYTHLNHNGVTKGDIFLYFGWFRNTRLLDGKLSYDKCDKFGSHIIYGYLQVGDIKKVNNLEPEEWMKYHPHVVRGRTASDNDYVYIAGDTLSWDSTMKGYGMFHYDSKLKLTKDGMSRSKWNIPEIFKNTTISYHNKNSWKDGYFQSAAKGQEFVIECTSDIELWTKDIIQSCSNIS